MNKTFIKAFSVSVVVGAAFAASSAQAACSDFSRPQVKAALQSVVAGNTSAGFNLPMWLTIVDETGTVCEVMTSDVSATAVGTLAGNSKWLGSRVISAQKANTANAFSLNGVAISSGALYAAVQPGASLYGLQESNPVDATKAYAGSSASFGMNTDPLKGQRIGGINVFGGGLAVYKGGVKVGAIGVSGDTSCTDHAVAWQVRDLITGVSASPGPFEKLTITGTYVNLGDHPDCPLSGDLGTAGTRGYNAPI